jgi:hypothetical protein
VYVMSVYAPTKASAASDTYTRLAFRRNVPLTRTESVGMGGRGARVRECQGRVAFRIAGSARAGKMTAPNRALGGHLAKRSHAGGSGSARGGPPRASQHGAVTADAQDVKPGKSYVRHPTFRIRVGLGFQYVSVPLTRSDAAHGWRRGTRTRASRSSRRGRPTGATGVQLCEPPRRSASHLRCPNESFPDAFLLQCSASV